MTPDEKRQQVHIENDGTIRNFGISTGDSKSVQKWGEWLLSKFTVSFMGVYLTWNIVAESLPKIKPIKSNLNSDSVICGDIGKALRHRRNSFSTTEAELDIEKSALIESPNRSESSFVIGKEVTEFDGETEAAIVEDLQNEYRNILDELEEWRNEFLGYGQ